MNKKHIYIGLGNFPDKYTYTRHNIGKDFLLFLYNNQFEINKLYYHHNLFINNTEYLFIIPNTYMNNSGDIFNDINLKNIIKNNCQITIIHDDLQIPFGKYKLRNNNDRGERGHNGNRSINKILKEIQKTNYIQPYYLSIGIGRPINEEVSDWVLKKFLNTEIIDLENNIYPAIQKEFFTVL